MNNGKLVFPPVTLLLIHTKIPAGIYSFLPKHISSQHIKGCTSETDHPQGLESLLDNSFLHLGCNAVIQVTHNPYTNQVQRKRVTIQPQA